MVSHEDRKKERLWIIKKALNDVKKKDRELDEEKLIAECCMKWGTSRRTILEYIKIIRLADE